MDRMLEIAGMKPIGSRRRFALAVCTFACCSLDCVVKDRSARTACLCFHLYDMVRVPTHRQRVAKSMTQLDCSGLDVLYSTRSRTRSCTRRRISISYPIST